MGLAGPRRSEGERSPLLSAPALRAERAAWIVLAIGLAAVAALLLAVPCLPFQDLPNHALVLLLDHAPGKEINPYFIRPEVKAFGYTLSAWLGRGLLGWMSVDAVLRLLCLAAALALPLATARLAKVLGGDPAAAGILALPLALGWPMRMGFVSFVLGLPIVLMGTAAAVQLCRERTWRRAGELALWAIAAYAMHAFAFAFLCVLAVLAWLCTGAWRLRALASLFAALLPAALMAASDVMHRALSSVIERDPSVPAAGVSFRPLGRAFVNIASRAYGIENLAGFWFYFPHLLLLAVGTAWLLTRGERSGARRLALWGAGLFTLGSVASPDSFGNVYLLGPRVNVIGLCFAIVAAVMGLATDARNDAQPDAPFATPRFRVLLAATACTSLALAVSGMGIIQDARRVGRVVGAEPPRTLSGQYFPIRAADCSHIESYLWGNWDPLRHVWAYALSAGGGGPYLFTRHRYAPVWYRVEAIQPHPFEGLVLSDEEALSAASCARRNRERVEGSLTWPGYDGVILAGSPEATRAALDASDVSAKERLAPGIWRLAPESRAIVDFGNPAAYRTDRGGFGRDERREGRTVSWSEGTGSWLDLDLAASPGSAYRMRLRARPLATVLPQTVAIAINGVAVARIDYPTAIWRVDEVMIPPGVLRSGRNRFAFAYAKVAGAEDSPAGTSGGSSGAMLFDRLEIAE
jgi:hypothetical protein